MFSTPASMMHGVFSCSISTAAGATYMLAVDDWSLTLVSSNFSITCIANTDGTAIIVIIPILVLGLVVSIFIHLTCYCHFKHAQKAALWPFTFPTATSSMIQAEEPAVPCSTAIFSDATAIFSDATISPHVYAPSAPSTYGSIEPKPPAIE